MADLVGGGRREVAATTEEQSTFLQRACVVRVRDGRDKLTLSLGTLHAA